MEFEAEFTIPANTAQTSPAYQVMKVSRGVITRVMVRPRPGHAALAHLQIRYHEHQLYPTNPDGDFHGDQHIIEWDEYKELTAAPFDLRLVGWNTDDTYEHTFDVGVAILEKNYTLPQLLIQGLRGLFSIFIPRRPGGGG